MLLLFLVLATAVRAANEDCLGVPNGTNIYDICGVCMGDASTCKDCLGIAGGTTDYDRCGVCGGDDSTRDCTGTAGGEAVLDRCGVCNGDDACFDCAGVPFGSEQPDACGICFGHGDSCRDCAGVPNGPHRLDACGVCDGTDNSFPCENPPPADNSFVASVNGRQAFVLTVVVGIFAIVCFVTFAVFAYMAKTRASPLVVRGNVSSSKTVALLVLALAVPTHAVLPQTTQFLTMMATHTNARLVYPEWFDATGSVKSSCQIGMAGLTCQGSDILSVSLSRSALIGLLQPADRLFDQLPLARDISIRNVVNFRFTLEGIGNMTLLRGLRLRNTGVYGTIPSAIGECSALQSLNVVRGSLIGSLPSALGRLVNLRDFVVAKTKLSSISAVAYDNLLGVERLALAGNEIAGTIPQRIALMNSLLDLDLSNNRLSGTIPVGFRDTLLTSLNLASNELSGADDPNTAFQYGGTPLSTSLQTLILDNNNLGPELPNLTVFSKLRHLGLSRNQFSRPAFETDFLGTRGFYIPNTFAHLLYLDVSYNQFRTLDPLIAQDQPFVGVCNFTHNFLCDNTPIPAVYQTANCDLGLLSNGCSANCADRTCFDCRGTRGSATYDACGVCGGDGTTCLDCNYVPNGLATYDQCGVCNGQDESCMDCSGVPRGTRQYDVCDVCDGDGSTCVDCAGVVGGSSAYDHCDVCNGGNATCTDCTGALDGSATFDECGVCRGDGRSCADPLTMDYIRQQGAFGWFVFLAILLAALVVLAATSGWLVCLR